MSSDKESLSSKYSSPGEKWRNGFEMVESAGEVRNAEKAEVFELQLVQLQEQLVSSMIENQNMGESVTSACHICLSHLLVMSDCHFCLSHLHVTSDCNACLSCLLVTSACHVTV